MIKTVFKVWSRSQEKSENLATQPIAYSTFPSFYIVNKYYCTLHMQFLSSDSAVILLFEAVSVV
jgi:hypothetical protein